VSRTNWIIQPPVEINLDQTKNTALISMLAAGHPSRYYADIRWFWRVGHGAIDRAGFASEVGAGVEAAGGETKSQRGAGASRDFEGGAHGDEAPAVGDCAGGNSKRGG
jgi:hypothetical protein